LNVGDGSAHVPLIARAQERSDFNSERRERNVKARISVEAEVHDWSVQLMYNRVITGYFEI